MIVIIRYFKAGRYRTECNNYFIGIDSDFDNLTLGFVGSNNGRIFEISDRDTSINSVLFGL